MEKSKYSFKLTSKVALYCLIFTSVFFILSVFISNENISLNPFISPFIHVDLIHFSTNMLVIFLAMLHTSNREYKFKDLYWISFLISLFYLPVSLLGITPIAIGLSGTGYFLVTRAGLSWNLITKFFVLFLAFIEIVCLSDLSDGIAHGVHLIGMALGYISLKWDFSLLNKKPPITQGI